MNIQISKEVYDKLSKDDKLRYIYIKTDPTFPRLILQTRKSVGNPIYGVGKDRIEIKTQKRLNKSLKTLLKNYPILDSSWKSFLWSLILYDTSLFYPDKYGFSADSDGSVQINIKAPTTQSDFINWVNKNWKRIKNLSRISKPTDYQTIQAKKSFIPEYENLKDLITIIKLKKSKKKNTKQIAEIIDKKDLKSQVEKINKAYHRISRQLKNLEKEATDRNKIISSLFNN